MNRSQLTDIIKQKGSFLCVGLDPDPARMPAGFEGADGILAFNKAIIDATRPFAAAYKPNIAFYEALGPEGWEVLSATLDYIGDGHFTIADAKRGDIGNTAKMYAQTFFETYAFDSVTVAPYMGSDSVEPFLSFPEKWAVILALTSNVGADDFQLIEGKNGTPVYLSVLQKAATWGRPDNTMFVVGATRPEMFKAIREVVPDHFLLVPGVGAQGGSLRQVCQYGLNSDVGLLVNASRSILYASGGTDFAEAAASVAESTAVEMKDILRKKSLL
jgi:orotidine-5'-phosphate decarboxylase